MNDFATWLNVNMENSHISGNKLAKMLGVNISQVSRYRHGRITPTLPIIHNIAKIFEVDPIRLAVLTGRLPREMAHADPLPVPEPTERLEKVRRTLEGIPYLTDKQIKAMIKAMKEKS
jgi:transcriptional regulator with XRE-family HTH domain